MTVASFPSCMIWQAFLARTHGSISFWAGRSLWEIPPSTLNVGGFRIAIGGGGYLRALSYPVLNPFYLESKPATNRSLSMCGRGRSTPRNRACRARSSPNSATT